MSKKKIRIFYRAPSHVPIWKVMEAAGCLEKHGLEMEFGSLVDKRKRATEGLLTGEFDIVSGNHHSLYARRALQGDPFVHIAQLTNRWNQHWMIAREGFNTLADLKGKRVVNAKIGGHMGLNVWLHLRQNGLEDGKNIQLIDGDNKGIERARHVMAGVFDACFVGNIDQLRARKLGAHVVELPTFPMIEGPTITTTTPWVNNHPEQVSALLHAFVDAIHFFKTQREETLRILKECQSMLRTQSEEELEAFYDERADEYQAKPYPTIEAIQNVFQLGLKETPEMVGFNPLVMWDMHHLRAIDDSGYIDRLYESASRSAVMEPA
jgi:ABC-type nitrate/sulfonate/bicarbonate transport system substrate-binding protein